MLTEKSTCGVPSPPLVALGSAPGATSQGASMRGYVDHFALMDELKEKLKTRREVSV
jgi:hypothetical protein